MSTISRKAVLINGRIFAGCPEDGETLHQAVLLKGNRIETVGANRKVLDMAGDPAESGAYIIDLGGRTVIPGFVDSHNHVMSTATLLEGVDCFGLSSIEDLKEAVREKATRTPPGEWIVGAGWIESQFKEGRMPDRHDLDQAAPNNPVRLSRLFGASAVNSLALKVGGIGKGFVPQAGRVDLDPSGEPTGILREAAQALVRRTSNQAGGPKTQEAQKAQEDTERRICLALSELLKYGITSVLDPGVNAPLMRAYTALWARKGLPMRVSAMPAWHGISVISGDYVTYPAIEAGLQPGLGDEWFRFGNLKMAIDGGLGSKTALMHDPFRDWTRATVPVRLDLNKLGPYIREANEAGWGVGIHCCGDLAQDMAVSHIADAFSHRKPTSNHRHHIVHGYFPTEYSLKAMSDCGIGVSLQPSFMYVEGDIYPQAIHESRLKEYKPMRTYLERGIEVAINTDVASGPYNPMVVLYAAVARKTVGGLSFGKEEALTPYEAVRCFSAGGAYLAYREKECGTLERGKLADLAILDRDIFDGAEEDILNAGVEATVLDGKFVYLAPECDISVPGELQDIRVVQQAV